jgi:hypothetical protein
MSGHRCQLNRSRRKPSQGSVPAGLTLASDSSFCFQCKEGSGFVLRRPIEITAFIGHKQRVICNLLRKREPAPYRNDSET